jgi:hypothetical protein
MDKGHLANWSFSHSVPKGSEPNVRRKELAAGIARGRGQDLPRPAGRE